jgi:hypothetical protein
MGSFPAVESIFNSYNDDKAIVWRINCDEAGTYRVYVHGDSTAVAILVNPMSGENLDVGAAVYGTPATFYMGDTLEYYLVVHIGEMYNNNPVELVDSIMVTVYFERIGD